MKSTKVYYEPVQFNICHKLLKLGLVSVLYFLLTKVNDTAVESYRARNIKDNLPETINAALYSLIFSIGWARFVVNEPL